MNADKSSTFAPTSIPRQSGRREAQWLESGLRVSSVVRYRQKANRGVKTRWAGRAQAVPAPSARTAFTHERLESLHRLQRVVPQSTN